MDSEAYAEAHPNDAKDRRPPLLWLEPRNLHEQGNHMASHDNGLASWENEGGALASDRLSDQLQLLERTECEEHILRRLGASVVALWKNLPPDIQRRLFLHATSFETVREKELIARRLHAASAVATTAPLATAGANSGNTHEIDAR